MPTVNATDDEIRAVEGFKDTIRTARGRRDFATAKSSADKENVFNKRRRDKGAEYQNIPEKVRALLESLSDSELALLSDIDQTFVSEGLWVSTSRGSVMAH